MDTDDQLEGWIGTGDAAGRLDVKSATLYAYVSRGVLTRRRSRSGRSLFDPAEIERLARRGRPRRPRGPAELVIESQLTALAGGRPFYRGRDALELAVAAEFEDVAGWLWTGEAARGARWQVTQEGVAAGRGAQSGLPAQTLPLERLQVITAALATADPLRLNLDPPAVVAAGQNLIAGMVDCLPGADPAAGPHFDTGAGTIAARLWSRLTAAPPDPERVDLLRAALVLLADHELAASTLAARVAASVRAGPYGVVSAGLSVLGGALHGGASLGVEALLAETGEPAHAGRAVDARLRRGERIPGFGHTVYTSGDRRAAFLLAAIRSAAGGDDRLAVADAILAQARQRRLPEVNVDFALATLASVTRMISGAGEAIFAVSRTAGWLAHALEQYTSHAPLRPRAAYTGPAPRAAGR